MGLPFMQPRVVGLYMPWITHFWRKKEQHQAQGRVLLILVLEMKISRPQALGAAFACKIVPLLRLSQT